MTFDAAKEGHYERLWRDECEAGTVTRKERDAAQADARRWRTIAVYLADLHAATAGHDLSLKSTSHSRKSRLASICEKALAMLTGKESPPGLSRYRGDDEAEVEIHKRLQDIVETWKKES